MYHLRKLFLSRKYFPSQKYFDLLLTNFLSPIIITRASLRHEVPIPRIINNAGRKLENMDWIFASLCAWCVWNIKIKEIVAKFCWEISEWSWYLLETIRAGRDLFLSSVDNNFPVVRVWNQNSTNLTLKARGINQSEITQESQQHWLDLSQCCWETRKSTQRTLDFELQARCLKLLDFAEAQVLSPIEWFLSSPLSQYHGVEWSWVCSLLHWSGWWLHSSSAHCPLSPGLSSLTPSLLCCHCHPATWVKSYTVWIQQIVNIGWRYLGSNC